MTDYPSAALYRRLFAMLYDGMLLLAVLFIASAIPLIFTGGEAIQGHNLLLSGYFLLIIFGFFGWFWTHGGQTLGMRAWRLQLIQDNGTEPGWLAALLRFVSGLPAWLVLILGTAAVYFPGIHLPGILGWLQTLPHGVTALLGIGLLWIIVDNWPNGWRERVTHTRVIQLPKR